VLTGGLLIFAHAQEKTPPAPTSSPSFKRPALRPKHDRRPSIAEGRA
jgi:hypothetical protein